MSLDDSALFKAKEIEQGSFEANLGGNIYTKCIALGNRGKSSGAGTIVAFKISKRKAPHRSCPEIIKLNSR